MKQNPTHALNKALSGGVSWVLFGLTEEFTMDHICPAMVEDLLVQDFEYKLRQFKADGRTYEWEMTFTKGRKSYTAKGNGYLGSFSFAKTQK